MYTNEHGCVTIKLYLQRQVEGQVQPVGQRLRTSGLEDHVNYSNSFLSFVPYFRDKVLEKLDCFPQCSRKC